MGKDKSTAKSAKSTAPAKVKAPKREPSPTPSSSSSASSSGSESDYSDSSDDTVEDEDGEELTPAMDAAILRTLAKIRRKEAGVYGSDRILEAELAAAQAEAGRRGLAERAAAKESKPFLLKDLHRQNLLEGVVDSDDDAGDGEYYRQPQDLTNAEAERRARDDALSAFAKFAEDSDDEDGDEDAGGLKKRAKDADEEAEDAAAYRQFLLEMGGGEAEVRAALGMADAPVTDYREDVDGGSSSARETEDAEVSEKKRAKREAKRRAKRAQADEDFLMDYILNRGWIDNEKKAVPTYDEIVGRPRAENGSEDEGGSRDDDEHPWGKLDEEDEFDDKAEEFETEYNFRFEEPGSSRIITHPRQIDNAVRRGDDSRKLKRAARAERKAAEKAAREEETRRRKGEKRREMGAQLEALKRELGEDGVDWAGVEKVLEGEWDEAEWERVVGAMLAAKDAAEDGDGDGVDDEKPSWDDGLGDEYLSAADDDDVDAELDADDAAYAAQGDGDVDMEWAQDAWADERGNSDDDDDGPINMDADFDGVDDRKKGKKESKKERKRRRAAEAAAAAAGEDDSEMTVEQRAERMKAAADELRGLDHEDEVGGLRTRFKYTRTAPQSFGLTTEEILLATDAELNSLVSMKHMQPYRRHGLGRAGVGLGRRVRELKAKLARRKWGAEEEDDDDRRPRAKPFHIERQGPGGSNAVALGKRSRRESDATSAGGDKKRAGKRLGRKERLKAAAAAAEAGGDGEAPAALDADAEAAHPAKRRKTLDGEAAATGGDADPAPEGKKRARKKKKRASAAE